MPTPDVQVMVDLHALDNDNNTVMTIVLTITMMTTIWIIFTAVNKNNDESDNDSCSNDKRPQQQQ